jgi:DNA-binding NarL/FixJ family response regulator
MVIEEPGRNQNSTPAGNSQNIRVVIIDDHPVVRFGLEQMLSSDHAIEVVAELSDVDGLPGALKNFDVDIVLLDLELEHTHGVEALRYLMRVAPNTRVIIYTSYDDENRIVQAAELGVAGYLLKGCNQQELLSAIHTVFKGGTALESRVTATLMKHMNRRSRRAKEAEAFGFSKREKQVLQLLAGGKTNRDIGKLLFISESTVKFHMHAILDKLDAKNRTEAVSIAAQYGIIELKVNA